MNEVSWSFFKSFITSSNLKWIYVEEPDNAYSVYVSYKDTSLKCYLKNGSSDYIDFDTNFKSLGNTDLVEISYPFTDKKLPNGKKLYARTHGVNQAVSIGSNIIDFSIPYPQVKFNEIEIIGSEIGDTCNLKILDNSSGTYTAIPNQQLNQFGFDVNLPNDYYQRASSYDADLYTTMRIYVEYESASAKTIYINYVLHEVKD